MRRAVTRGLLAVAVGAGGLLACDTSDPGGPARTIGADVFIDTYVDLRIAGLSTTGQEIAAEERERILAEHGVDADDLLEFVDQHGTDVPYIAQIWDSVEVRFRRERDSIHAQGGDSAS